MNVQQHFVVDRVEHRDAAPVEGVGHAAMHVVQQQAEHAATAAGCHGESGVARQRLQDCDSQLFGSDGTWPWSIGRPYWAPSSAGTARVWL